MAASNLNTNVRRTFQSFPMNAGNARNTIPQVYTRSLRVKELLFRVVLGRIQKSIAIDLSIKDKMKIFNDANKVISLKSVGHCSLFSFYACMHAHNFNGD